MIIFYSWQSDVGKHKWLIEDCIKKAIKNVNIEGGNLVLDRDTKDIIGAVNILNTLIGKIKKSQIFVADLTIINSDYEGRKTPNPNVLYETGFATGFLGEKYIICLYDDEYGKVEKDFPFDIKANRIQKFSPSDKPGLIKNLTRIFKKTIQNLDERDKSHKIKSAIELEDETSRIKKFIRLFKRRAFNAPFDQEHPVEMYESINEVRLEIQRSGLIYDISDFGIAKVAKDVLAILNSTITDINSQYPIIKKMSTDIEQISRFDILKNKIISEEDCNGSVSLMSSKRHELRQKLNTIEVYYGELNNKNEA